MNKLVWALVALAMVAPAALADEMVDNPQYKSWAGCKVGAMVKMVTTSEVDAGGMKMTTKSTMTSTLKELTPEKAVVETVTEMDMGGTKTAMPATKQEIPARVKASAAQPATMEGAKVTKKGEGDEEIAVGGKKYKCHWVETETVSDQMASTSKVWTSPEIPGGTVKMVSDVTKPMKSKTTMEVTEFKAGG
jgi:hypothetical protein